MLTSACLLHFRTLLWAVAAMLLVAGGATLFGWPDGPFGIVLALLAAAGLAFGADRLHLAVQTARWNAGRRVY